MKNDDNVSGNMPDEYDRLLGLLDGLNDVVHTNSSTVQVIPTFGVGGTETFIVTTFRQKDKGDSIFLQRVDKNGAIRIVIPAKVADLIARQRDQLTAKARSKAAKASAAERKEAGIVPFAKKGTRG